MPADRLRGRALKVTVFASFTNVPLLIKSPKIRDVWSFWLNVTPE